MGLFSGGGGLIGAITRPFVGRPPETRVTLPGRSPEEIELLRRQNELLTRQATEFDVSSREAGLLRPFLLSEAGVEEVRGPGGELTGFRRAPSTPEQEQQRQIETKLRERTLAALEGNLPVDPTLERNIAQGRLDLREQLRRQLGPGFETSTPGIQAVEEFNKRAEELRFGARTGTLTTAEALAGAREARTLGAQAQRFGQIGSAGQFQLPFTAAGTTLAQAFASPLRTLLGEREAGLTALTAQRGREFDLFGSRLNVLGTLFGAFSGGGGRTPQPSSGGASFASLFGAGAGG